MSTIRPKGEFLTGGERTQVKGMEGGYVFLPTVIGDVAWPAR
jgi:hypothetical protein